ncbi:MAG TPA: glutamyl-tRNA reductase, partial [Ktedonobacterales bacterium]|nr:glutamyl-tRNA reductase [Ktedonobacterales bacterium]
APLFIRERLAFDTASTPAALDDLRSYVAEALILSTCNRTEIIALVPDANTGTVLLHNFLARHCGIAPSELAPYLYSYSDDVAVRHVFRLAAGLDSTVIGEDQIVLQIKDAQTAARDAGMMGKTLHRLVNRALAAGKRVRTETQIATQHVSVVSVALDLARMEMGSLAGKQIAVVGAGRVAELALKHLKGHNITVYNRTTANGEDLARRYAVNFRPLSALPHEIGAYDIAISSTTAPHVVITAVMIEQALAARKLSVLLDLAMPRDIDPAVASAGVRLFDIDGIQEIAEANRATRAGEIEHAEAMVAEEVRAFMDWWSTQEIVPTIQALRERAETIRAAELQRALARLPDLTPQQQEAVQAMSSAIVNKLLHEPIVTLKDPSAGNELAGAVRRLFHLADITSREAHVIES